MNASRSKLIRLAVIDDDCAVLDALGDYLERVPELGRPLLFLSPKEADACVRRRRLDIALVDLHLPGDNGLRYLGRLHRLGRIPHLIAYTASEDPAVIVEAFRAGANGYIPKTCSLAEVAARLIRLKTGEPAVDAAAHRWLVGSYREKLARESSVDLGELELSVMRLTREGRSCKEIAEQLGKSIHTIYKLNRRIGQKLGTQGRLAAACVAVQM